MLSLSLKIEFMGSTHLLQGGGGYGGPPQGGGYQVAMPAVEGKENLACFIAQCIIGLVGIWNSRLICNGLAAKTSH